ncbi:MAG: class I SAM-dependent methyltransferase [Bacteroidota bacterium]
MKRAAFHIAGLCLCLVLVLACRENKAENKPPQLVKPPVQVDREILYMDPDSSLEGRNLDSGDRTNWQKPQVVISQLGDLSNKVVADIGAGTGYFTMRLARFARKVIAIDIDSTFLSYIERRAAKTTQRKHRNIETRLTMPDDPSLQQSETDLVLIVNTYAYIQDRVDYFRKVHAGLRESGHLVVVDFKKRPLPVGPPSGEKVNAATVITEMDSAGFKVVSVDSTSLQYQYQVRLEKS